MRHRKSNRTVRSTTVPELYSVMKCVGACQFIRGLWMGSRGDIAMHHMRADSNNLATTAATTHVPEHKETMHMVQMMRIESCSGAIEDLAHARTEVCLP